MLSLFILYLTARSLLTNRVLASSDDNTDLEGLQGVQSQDAVAFKASAVERESRYIKCDSLELALI